MGHHESAEGKPFKADSMPEYGWAVWFNDVRGKRVRRLFKTKTAANAFADDLAVKAANLGNQRAALLTDSVLRDAAEAWKLVEPLGVSLLDVAKDYASRAAYRRQNVTVRALVDGFIESHRLRESSDIHQKVRKSRLGKFAEAFGKASACDVGKPEITGVSIHERPPWRSAQSSFASCFNPRSRVGSDRSFLSASAAEYKRLTCANRSHPPY